MAFLDAFSLSANVVTVYARFRFPISGSARYQLLIFPTVWPCCWFCRLLLRPFPGRFFESATLSINGGSPWTTTRFLMTIRKNDRRPAPILRTPTAKGRKTRKPPLRAGAYEEKSDFVPLRTVQVVASDSPRRNRKILPIALAIVLILGHRRDFNLVFQPRCPSYRFARVEFEPGSGLGRR